MRKLIRWLALASLSLLFGACATTSNPQMQLVGNVINPMASVLAYEGQQCGNANAILNYNIILNACQHGLPISGAFGSLALQQFCAVNGYNATGLAPLTWAPVATPPAMCASSPNIAAAKAHA